MKIFVSATEFCCSNMYKKKSNPSDRIFATCCGDEILLQKHRFSHKFSGKRGDMSPQRVAATSRPTCTHAVICRRDFLLQLA